MANTLPSTESGAAGRPTLTSLTNKAISRLRAESGYGSLNVNPSAHPVSERDTLKLNMLRRIRPAPLKYAWTFYHHKYSASADYEGRLTVMMENIITIKTFWEVFNQFPLEALKPKDTVHFFKRGMKPAWEDSRNIAGGSWTFRVPKAQSAEFWKETLLMAVGEQFADAIEPRQSLWRNPHLLIANLSQVTICAESHCPSATTPT